MRTPETPDWKQLVLDWQRPVYNLAHRMLGNAADAEDATQDAFVRLYEQLDRYDPSRPLGPWVYRVATNVVLNRIRRERARPRGRTARDPAFEEAPSVAHPSPHQASQALEQQAVVQAHLDEVAPAARAVLVLHFHLGLSKREIADVLDVPRTTVQSRFGKGLETLRGALSHAGHAALVPAADGLLRAAPSVAVPSRVSESLLSIAAKSAAAATATGAVVIGGVVMTKNLMFGAAVAATLLLGAGYVAGLALADDGGAVAEAPTIDEPAMTELETENERLRGELARLRGAGPGLAPAAREAALDVGDPAAASDAGASADGGHGSQAKADAIDFSALGALLAKHLDVLVQTQKTAGADMTPAQQAAAMEVLDAYMRASREARALSPTPFFDERVLPGFVDAVYAAPLALPDDVRRSLAARVTSLLADTNLDTEVAPTVERFLNRQLITREVETFVERAAGPDAEPRLEAVRSVARHVMSGSKSTARIGITEDSDEERLIQTVLETWKRVYGIESDDTLRSFHGAASQLVRAGRDTLRQNDLFEEGASWEPAEHPEVEEAMLRAQVEAERSVLHLLTPSQRAKARTVMPHLVLFEHGQGSSSVSMNSGGI